MSKTAFAVSIRESVEHILNYLESASHSELLKSESAALDAQALAYTRRELLFAKKLGVAARNIGSPIHEGLAK